MTSMFPFVSGGKSNGGNGGSNASRFSAGLWNNIPSVKKNRRKSTTQIKNSNTGNNNNGEGHHSPTAGHRGLSSTNPTHHMNHMSSNPNTPNGVNGGGRMTQGFNQVS
jgi:hypothetical protein